MIDSKEIDIDIGRSNTKKNIVIKLFGISFCFFYPMIFNYTLGSIQTLIVVISLIYSLFQVLKMIKRNRMSNELLVIIIFEIWMLITTLLNFNLNESYDYIIWGRNALLTIGLALYIEKEASKNPQELIKSLYLLFSLYVYINFILIILFPEGLIIKSDYYNINNYKFNIVNNIYFLGHRNNTLLVFMPAMIISQLYHSLYDRKLFSHFLLITTVLCEAIYVGSASGIVGCFLLAVYFVGLHISKIKNILLKLTSLNLVISYIIIFFAIVVFRLQELFSYIIENILHRSVHFTGRTGLWDNAIKLIRESPIYGYGTHAGGNIIFFNYRVWYAHNYIYDLLIQGGFISIVIIIVFIVNILIKIKRCKDSLLTSILSWGMFSLGIVALVESYYNFTNFTLIFIISYNINKFKVSEIRQIS